MGALVVLEPRERGSVGAGVRHILRFHRALFNRSRTNSGRYFTGSVP